MKSHRHPKIHYPAGLISLILLPALCVLYTHYNTCEKQTVLEVQYFNPEGYKNNDVLHLNYPKNSHPKRNYLDIQLDGDDVDDSIRLALGQLSIRSLKVRKDTISGIHFHLNGGAKVWSLIAIFDMCHIEHAQSWSADGNDFWVFNMVKQTSGIPTKVGRVFFCDTRFNKVDSNNKNAEMLPEIAIRQSFYNYIIRYFWPSAIIFMSMFLLELNHHFAINKQGKLFDI